MIIVFLFTGIKVSGDIPCEITIGKAVLKYIEGDDLAKIISILFVKLPMRS